jgi:uncharacterized membrane protein
MKTFSIEKAFSNGWKIFKENWVYLIMLQIGIIVVSLISGAVVDNTDGVLQIIAQLLNVALSLIVGMGTMYILLRLVDHKPVTYMSLFEPIDHFWNFLFVGILTCILMVLGLIALIIPGIIIGAALSLAQYIVVDTNMGPIDALKKSWEVTKGNRGRLILFLFAFVFVTLCGLLAFGVGILVSSVVAQLAFASVYRDFIPAHVESHSEEQK